MLQEQEKEEILYRCPSCNNRIRSTVRECSSCGVIFEKWKEREARIQKNLYSAKKNKPRPAKSAVPVWLILAALVLIVIQLFR